MPFDLTVPANNAFYVACRNEVRNAPIVKVFIDWLFASLETDTITEPQTSARRIIRRRNGKVSAPERLRHPSIHPDDTPETAGSRAEAPRKNRYSIGLLPMTAALLNPLVTRLSPPPIPAVQAWGKSYDGGLGPLIDLSQAVPGYPPHPDMLRWLGEAASSLAYTNYGRSRARQLCARPTRHMCPSSMVQRLPVATSTSLPAATRRLSAQPWRLRQRVIRC